jgi:hypothetical protein
MKAGTRWSIVAVIAMASAVMTLYSLREAEPPAAVPPVVPLGGPAPLVQGEPGTMPPIRHPIEAVGTSVELPEADSLPALDESDSVLRTALDALFAKGGQSRTLLLEDMIRRIVVTVDNLPRDQLARRQVPLKPAEGSLLVTGQGDERVISEHNQGRYAPYVVLAEAVDVDYMTALYVRFYPLFQQAYQELGYPEGYFNDRLVWVIDHLLAAPELEGPIRLVQPKVLYRFADAELEQLSVGQKFLVRMGPANAARIKARLREVRRHVAGRMPEP